MPDLIERLRELDRIEPPDVWSDVERLGPRTPIEPGPSPLRRAGAALLALAVAVGGFLLVDRAFRGALHKPAQTPSPTVSVVGPAKNGLIAFDCGYHVCTVMPDGSRFTDLIEPYDKDVVLAAYGPVFSPDGSKIAFRGYNHQGSSSGGGANYDTYVMNSDGTGVTNLTTSPEDVNSGFSQVDAQWSPDGSMIAYEGDDGLYVMNADGSDQRKLADGGPPAWSPDGSRIVFSMGADHGADLWTIHPDGSGLAQLTQSPKWDELATWSPDGSRIAFLRGNAIYVVNQDGTGLSVLAYIKGVDPFQPQWSPDGTRLVFEAEVPVSRDMRANNERNFDIYSVNADGTDLAAIAHDPNLDENWPVWSPDGTLIAFGATDNLGPLNDGTWDLYVMRPDGSGTRQLTKNAGLGAEFDISWQQMP